MSTSKTPIQSKSAIALKAVVSGAFKYEESLIAAANARGLAGETAAECLKSYRAQMAQQYKEWAAKWGMTPARAKRLQNKGKEILSGFHTGHSMGCYREIFIFVEGGPKYTAFAVNHDCQEYAKSCDWKPTYGRIEITMTAAQLARLVKNEAGEWFDPRTKKTLRSRGSKHRFELFWA